jgi:hypothetical protein
MPDALAIAEDLAKRHPSMRLEKALGQIKHEMLRQEVLAELRAPAASLRPAEPSAVARVAANLRELADRLEGSIQ